MARVIGLVMTHNVRARGAALGWSYLLLRSTGHPNDRLAARACDGHHFEAWKTLTSVASPFATMVAAIELATTRL